MDALRLETMTTNGQPIDKGRQKALAAANDFERMFVRTLVGSLRQTSTLGGEGGGMFGSGPGADTFGDWFDQNLANQIGESGHVGIAEQVIRDLERHGEIESDAATNAARLAAERSFRSAALAAGKGGFDVVL